MYKEFDEQELARYCSRRDPLAEEELYRRYAARVYTLCRRYVGDDDEAMDLMQETLIQSLNKILTFNYSGRGSLYGWISRIAINKSLNHLKRHKWRTVSLDVWSQDNTPEPTDEEVENIPQEKLLEWISKLPELRRMVFNLYCIDGYSHKEIGKLLGISEKGSAGVLAKARKQLNERRNTEVSERTGQMRKWEDIVKERLEGYESALPAGNFADFRARRTASAGGSAGHLPAKRSALPWALAAAVAAVLAAVLLLRRPASPGDGVQPARHLPAPVAVAADTSEVSDVLVAELVQGTDLITQRVPPKDAVQQVVPPADPVIDRASPSEQGIVTTDPDDESEIPEQIGSAANTISPYIPETVSTEPVKMHFEPSAGLFAGGGLVAALATAVVNFTRASGSDPAIVPQTGPVDVGTPHLPQYISSNSYSHSLPFKGGFSVGISVANKTRITTGIQYITYRSSFTDILSKTQIQRAHYLSVPVRLDKILADNGRLEAYVGGGLEGDFCIAASLSGKEIDRDGFSISLLGAGGIQFNVSKHLGFYVEPELTWSLPSEGRTLQTYRSVNPFMFSINTGLRITMGNN